jgi:hypothetical protein
VGGLSWWAHIEWIQRQRPMWREHDANLASVWHHDDAPPEESDIGATLRERIVLDEVIVLHEVIARSESASSQPVLSEPALSEPALSFPARWTFRAR